MAAFTFKGVNYDVIQDGARQMPPRTVGSESESFDGTLRRTTRAALLSWDFKIGPISITQLATLRADAIASAGTATGDLLGGASYTCFVTLGETIYDKDEAAGTIFCVVTISVRQKS